jgi:hypothetical protein
MAQRTNPLLQARNNVIALLPAAHKAGWSTLRVELCPDGTITIHASMQEKEIVDDFLTSNLRIGK